MHLLEEEDSMQRSVPEKREEWWSKGGTMCLEKGKMH